MTQVELPHGHSAVSRQWAQKTTVPAKCEENNNFVKHNLGLIRATFAHQKRGRVSNLAGWEQAGRKVLARLMSDPHDLTKEYKIVKDDEASLQGVRFPDVLWPMFKLIWGTPPEPPMDKPQVIMVKDAVVLLMCFFCRHEKDAKNRLAHSVADVKDIRYLVVLYPVRADPPKFCFGPASQARIIKLKIKNTKTFALELEAQVELKTHGCEATLTLAATAAYHSIIADGIDAQLRLMEKKFDKEAAERASKMVIQSTPLKFVDGFVLNEHSFLHKPFTPTGMAESRSAIQYLALRRQQILALGDDEKAVSEKVLRAAPLYFDRELFRKLAPKTSIDKHSTAAFLRMKDCLNEFQIKKKDAKWQTIISQIHDHIY